MAFMVNKKFKDLKNEIVDIFKKIDPKIFKEKRWFQDKGATITKLGVYDYFIVDNANKDSYVIPLIAKFKVAGQENDLLYYIPIILSKNKYKGDCWLEITHKNYKAYIYSAINSKYYIDILKDEQMTATEAGGEFSVKRIVSNIASVKSLTEKTSNSLSLIDKREVVKTYRKLHPGLSIDIEIAEVLQKKTDFNNLPRLYGYVSYKDCKGNMYSLCLLQQYIQNQQTLWQQSQKNINIYLNKIKKSNRQNCFEYMTEYLAEIRQVGELIAELHIALVTGFGAVYPEIEDINNWIKEEKMIINKLCSHLDKNKLKEKDKLLVAIKKMNNYLPYLGKFIRIHGDLHLEQLLVTDKGFMILDFEGEPLKDMEDRRKKYSPLKDIAGMIRSFAYISRICYKEFSRGETSEYEDKKILKAVNVWEDNVSNHFLQGYLGKIKKSNNEDLIPSLEKLEEILALFILEKALYEALYEINNRPDWLSIPLAGIQKCLNTIV